MHRYKKGIYKFISIDYNNVIDKYHYRKHKYVYLTPLSHMFISPAIHAYIKTIELSRSAHTARTYKNALSVFQKVLQENHLNPVETTCNALTENAISWFAAALKKYAPATEKLYLTAATNFYAYLAAENISQPNLPRIHLLARQRARRTGQRLPQFPQSSIEEVLKYAINLTSVFFDKDADRLRNYRDRAFLLTLADTGLRVHEACSLRRGDIDWNEGRAIIIGKGDKQAVVRFSSRSIRALKDYLAVRQELDGRSGKPITSLPLFARHDKGAGKKIKPITTSTGRNIVSQRVAESLGSKSSGTITPHSFRHYFVTTVLRGSGGNLKLAQELARHQNIAVTQRYAHLSNDELDQGYDGIFNPHLDK